MKIKKYKKFNESADSESEIKEIFNNYLDEFGLHGCEFKIKSSNISVESIQVSIKLKNETIQISNQYRKQYIIDNKAEDLIEEIRDRMLDIKFKLIDVGIFQNQIANIGVRIIFSFQKIE